MREKTKDYLRFFADTLKYKKMVTFWDLICNAVLFSYAMGVAFCVKEILNAVESTQGQALSACLPYLGGIILITLIRVCAIKLCARLDAKRAYYYQGRLRHNLLKNLMEKKNVTEVSGKSAHIFELVDDDVPTCTFPVELLTEVGGYCIFTIASVCIMLAISWQLTLFAFMPLSSAIFFVQKLSEKMKERKRTNREASDNVGKFTGDVINAALTIKSMGAKDAVLEKYSHVNRARYKTVLKEALYDARVAFVLGASVCLGTAVILAISGGMIGTGAFGIGDLSFFIVNLGILADCINRIAETFYCAKQAEVSYERILESGIDRQELSAFADIDINRSKAPERKSQDRGDFSSYEVQNLSFSYDGVKAFDNVSFKITPGELMVISGEMASGKSTLLSVLMGLMTAESGKILWNGKSVRPQIAASPQRAGFFSGAVEENLRLGVTADKSKIMEAMEIAGIADLKPETEIGGRGDKLSGGQRQRLSLARTIVQGRPLIIIDDCFSALDEKTKTEVAEKLKAFLKKESCAAIIASNETNVLEIADSVLLMKDDIMKTAK